MRCMVMVKATAGSEAGEMPAEKDLADMGRFNQELVEAGVMLDGGGLHPTSEGARVEYADGKAQVTRGPFPGDAGTLVAGFWVWQVKSLDEAIEWASRIPFNHGEGVEIRPFFEPEDFGEEYTPDQQERDAELDRKIREQRA